jgi:ABC-2 type transport system ATP-binding protein
VNQYDAVSVSAVTVSYRMTKALRGVSFGLGQGVTGLLGPNGAGKTTLMRVLATAIVPDSGTVTVLGQDPLTPKGRQRVRRRLGYLPQDPGLYPGFTAFAFVDYVAILKELTDRGARHSAVREMLDQVGLAEQRGRRIRALSGGMRRRVALAAALVGDPDFVVLDEPTVGLDPQQRLRFRELIAEMGRDRTVVLSTHLTDDVAALCGRVIVLDHGTVRFDGTPAELAFLADGRVWSSAVKDEGALAGWHTGEGTYRNIGDPPPGARLLPPRLEDGYLLLLDGTASRGAAA